MRHYNYNTRIKGKLNRIGLISNLLSINIFLKKSERNLLFDNLIATMGEREFEP